MMYKKYVISLIFLCYAVICCGRKVSPIDFGLLDAVDGGQRYEVLLKTHNEAIKRHVGVTYKGLKKINIEVPPNAKSIPLTQYTDFAGVELVVENNEQDFVLFRMSQKSNPLDLTKRTFLSDNFTQVTELHDDYSLLIIEDETPWVKNRKGYSYGAQRRDIVLLKEGVAQNKPVQGYATDISHPVFKYCKVTSTPKIIKNLIFTRTKKSTYKTFLLFINNQNNVSLNNIVVNTPAGDMIGDRAIKITNCTNVTFEDVTINGTYSTEKKSGYGISLNNVWNTVFVRLTGEGDWGIFGNNNINTVHMSESEINRFDIHCYGKDIFFENCKFRDLYNQFSSIYGTISFSKCEFFDFTPVLFEPSYNAYTKFDLKFKNCIIHARSDKNWLISAGELRGENTDGRLELSKQEYPNLYINGLKIDMPDNSDVYYLYKFKKKLFQSPFNNVPGIIQIKNVNFTTLGKKLDYVNPISWMTALEVGVLSLAGSGLAASGVAAYHRFKKKNKNHCLV